MSNRNNEPNFELVEPPYCGECGHFHHPFLEHPELNVSCSSYLCCISDDENRE